MLGGVRRSALLCVVLAVVLAAPGASALSWPLCAVGGTSWVTERPETAAAFPGANLWFFCRSGINLLGSAVDVCTNNGTTCDVQAAADALCQVLGYDLAYEPDVRTILETDPATPVRALTGEYCISKGVYTPLRPNVTQLGGGTLVPDADVANATLASGAVDLVSSNSTTTPCTVLDSLTCIRTMESIANTISDLGYNSTAPASELVSSGVIPVLQGTEPENADTTAGRGRRLKLI